jgi:hypothetical protein
LQVPVLIQAHLAFGICKAYVLSGLPVYDETDLLDRHIAAEKCINDRNISQAIINLELIEGPTAGVVVI